MTRKRKLPQWLVTLLSLLLAVLVVTALLSALTGSPDLPPPVQSQAKPPQVPYDRWKPKANKPVPNSPAESPAPKPAPMPAPLVASAGIGLILDDAGFDMPALRRILDLSIPVAVAVLPGAPYARQAATLAHERDQVVMLHLPMEPLVPKYREKMTDTFLRTDMSEGMLRQQFLRDLEKVPFAEGVNNHMGSLLTTERSAMSQVMQICREKGLFFVDSKTNRRSVASETAESMDVAWAERHYFLDHNLDEAAMARVWERARACARSGQSCIVIAHPYPETVAFLENHLNVEDITLLKPMRSMLSRGTPLKAAQKAGSTGRAL